MQFIFVANVFVPLLINDSRPWLVLFEVRDQQYFVTMIGEIHYNDWSMVEPNLTQQFMALFTSHHYLELSHSP